MSVVVVLFFCRILHTALNFAHVLGQLLKVAKCCTHPAQV